MKSVMRYVSQTSKTLWDGQQLVSSIGCQPETAFDEFLSTKLLHHKDGGVMFYHMVQSFPKGADIDPRAAHEAARRLAGYFEGCEVLVCTHVDREHIHSHCIINSVNFETGTGTAAAVWNISAGDIIGTGKAIAALTGFMKKFWIKLSGIIQKSCGNNTHPN